MTKEQKRIEVNKAISKINKLSAYIKNNPPKTPKHALKLLVRHLSMVNMLYRLISTPTIRKNWQRGGAMVVGEPSEEVIINPHGIVMGEVKSIPFNGEVTKEFYTPAPKI